MFLADFTGFYFLWRDNHFFILCYQTFVKIRSVSSYGGCLHLETAHWYSDQLTGTGGLMSRRKLTEKQWFPFCPCSHLSDSVLSLCWLFSGNRTPFSQPGLGEEASQNQEICPAVAEAAWLTGAECGYLKKKQRKYWLCKIQDHLIGTVSWLLLLTSNIFVTWRWFSPGRARERSIVSTQHN